MMGVEPITRTFRECCSARLSYTGLIILQFYNFAVLNGDTDISIAGFQIGTISLLTAFVMCIRDHHINQYSKKEKHERCRCNVPKLCIHNRNVLNSNKNVNTANGNRTHTLNLGNLNAIPLHYSGLISFTNFSASSNNFLLRLYRSACTVAGSCSLPLNSRCGATRMARSKCFQLLESVI